MADTIAYTNGATNGVTNGLLNGHHMNGCHQNGAQNGGAIFHNGNDHPSDLYKVKDLNLTDSARADKVRLGLLLDNLLYFDLKLTSESGETKDEANHYKKQVKVKENVVHFETLASDLFSLNCQGEIEK